MEAWSHRGMGRTKMYAGRPPEPPAQVIGVAYGVATTTLELVQPDGEEDELEALVDDALERLNDNADAMGADIVYDLKIEISYFRVLRRGVKVTVVAYGTAARLSPPDSAQH